MSKIMLQPRIAKVVFNIGCGTKYQPEVAKKLLERITNKKAVLTIAKKRTTFGSVKGKPIGAMITVRGLVAAELTKRMLAARDNKISAENFDDAGNLNFGVKEYIDIPGIEYDTKVPMLGCDVCVSIERPGYRVKRKARNSKIGKKHLLTKEDSIKFVQEKFGVKFEKEENE